MAHEGQLRTTPSSRFLGLKDPTKMEAELQCAVCLEVMQAPCVLKCQHVFCSKCVLRLPGIQTGEARCPLCRNRTRVRANSADELPTCRLLESICRAVREATSRACSEHLDAVFEYYCAECDSMVCGRCALFGAHKGHTIECIDAVAESSRRTMMDSRQLLQAQHELVADEEQRISARYKDLTKRANGCVSSILSFLRHLQEQAHAAFEAHKRADSAHLLLRRQALRGIEQCTALANTRTQSAELQRQLCTQLRLIACEAESNFVCTSAEAEASALSCFESLPPVRALRAVCAALPTCAPAPEPIECQLFFSPNSAVRGAMRADVRWKLHDLKEAIESAKGLPARVQRIYLNSKVLEPTIDIGEQGVMHGCTIEVVAASGNATCTRPKAPSDPCLLSEHNSLLSQPKQQAKQQPKQQAKQQPKQQVEQQLKQLPQPKQLQQQPQPQRSPPSQSPPQPPPPAAPPPPSPMPRVGSVHSHGVDVAAATDERGCALRRRVSKSDEAQAVARRRCMRRDEQTTAPAEFGEEEPAKFGERAPAEFGGRAPAEFGGRAPADSTSVTTRAQSARASQHHAKQHASLFEHRAACGVSARAMCETAAAQLTRCETQLRQVESAWLFLQTRFAEELRTLTEDVRRLNALAQKELRARHILDVQRARLNSASVLGGLQRIDTAISTLPFLHKQKHLCAQLRWLVRETQSGLFPSQSAAEASALSCFESLPPVRALRAVCAALPTCAPAPEPVECQLFFSPNSAVRGAMRADVRWKLHDLKEAIESAKGLPARVQRIYLNSKVLEPTIDIGAQGVKHGCTIEVGVRYSSVVRRPTWTEGFQRTSERKRERESEG